MVPDNKRAPPLNSGQYTESGVMWNLKNEIISPRFYDLLTNTELKVDTALDLNNLYNHIKICLIAVTRILENPLPGY